MILCIVKNNFLNKILVFVRFFLYTPIDACKAHSWHSKHIVIRSVLCKKDLSQNLFLHFLNLILSTLCAIIDTVFRLLLGKNNLSEKIYALFIFSIS